MNYISIELNLKKHTKHWVRLQAIFIFFFRLPNFYFFFSNEQTLLLKSEKNQGSDPSLIHNHQGLPG